MADNESLLSKQEAARLIDIINQRGLVATSRRLRMGAATLRALAHRGPTSRSSVALIRQELAALEAANAEAVGIPYQAKGQM